MGARSRLVVRGTSSTGSPAIAIDKLLPFNCTLLQYLTHMDAVASSAGIIELRKISGASTSFDVTIDTIDPSEGGWGDRLCREQVEFLKGDRVQLSYTNPDNLNLGYELIFTEAD
jgi:hypothetical protein